MQQKRLSHFLQVLYYYTILIFYTVGKLENKIYSFLTAYKAFFINDKYL